MAVERGGREEKARQPALRADRLTVDFGGDPALEEVTFEVPAGSAVAVLGPNGAGKSTLFAAALRLVEPRAGAIELGSSRATFVPQRLEVDPTFPVTVEDVVRMGRYPDRGWLGRFDDRDRDLVAEAMELLHISGLAGRRFGDLSGGERQRTLLAQAAAQDAEIALLDEPFAGVDAPTHDVVRGLIERWREDRRTVIVATHDLQSAARDYDLVLALNRRVIGFGPASETLTEQVLAETFAGRVVRVGEMLVDVAHHHHGAG